MRTDRCSSTCAGEVSTVVVIGGSSAAQREYTGAASSSTSDSVRPQMRSTRRDRRSHPAIGARRSATTRSTIGFSSAGGPGSRSSTCPSCSSHSPGAVPYRVGQHVGALGHHRLPPVDLGHPRPARREALPDHVDELRLLAQRAPRDGRDGLARQVVVGRAEPPAHHHEVGARQRRAQDRLEVGGPVSDDGLGPDLDAVLVQPLRDEERIGVEPRRHQQFAADGDDLRPLHRWTAGGVAHVSSPGRIHSRSCSARLA